MPIHNKLADDVKEVDIIIAGGGTAGCIVAGRLAEADPSLVILVIEGGVNNKDMPTVRTPALFLTHLAPDSKTTIFYKGNKSEALGGREPIVPSGGVLGGGSSINFMMYTRAQRCDFDAWDMPGWSADEVLPFMNKLETYHVPTSNRDKHGYTGPVNVTLDSHWPTTARDQYCAASTRVGWPVYEELQDLDSNNGVQHWRQYIGPDGTRQDTAHRYIHDKIDSGNYPNLHVLVEAKVQRVLFDENKRAVGVEYTPNSAHQPVVGNLTGHPVATIKARKLVVVSSGALGSPPILERSGVGNAAVLKKAGIDVVEDLEGVGADYQDHHLILYPYHTNLKPEETFDGIWSGRWDAAAMIKSGDKLLRSNGVPVAGKLRMTDEEAKALGPEFSKAWDRDFKHIPSRPVMLTAIVNGFLGDPSLVTPSQYVTLGNYTAYPYSRGHCHVTGPGVDDPLDFETGFLGDEHDLDLKKHLWAYKKQREVARRMPSFRGELAIGHPAFPDGSAAALVTVAADAPPVDPDTVTDVAYTKDDDAAIETFIRANLNTTWHSLGTCKCWPREKGGVVDANLDVYGVTGLKVVDVSIVAVNVGANTNNTALMIGEKGAAMIIKELGIKPKSGRSCELM
jgi:alcohol oxidase